QNVATSVPPARRPLGRQDAAVQENPATSPQQTSRGLWAGAPGTGGLDLGGIPAGVLLSFVNASVAPGDTNRGRVLAPLEAVARAAGRQRCAGPSSPLGH